MLRTPDVASRSLGRRGWRSLVTGTALIVATVMPGFLTASLAPRIRADFAFGDATLGLAVGLFYVVSASLSVSAGRLVDRAGAARGMQLSGGLVVASCLAVAALAQSAASLAALLLIAGVANALGGPSVSALLKREVADHSQGLAFGAQQAGAPMGALLAGLALPALAIPFGWQWAFVAAAGLALFAVAFAPGAAATGARSAPAGRHPRGFSSVHALGVAAVLASAAGVGFVSFLVTYAVDSGMSEVAAGLLLAAVSLAATIGRIAVGVVADRGRRDPLRLVAAMLVLGVAGRPHAGRGAAQPAGAGLGGRCDDDGSLRGRGDRAPAHGLPRRPRAVRRRLDCLRGPRPAGGGHDRGDVAPRDPGPVLAADPGTPRSETTAPSS